MNFNLTDVSSNKSAEPVRVKMLILGSGPAGLSAALYAARGEMSPVVLTGMELGGQAGLTHTIENYPGFPDGVGGSELGELFRKQAERFGARVEFDTASEVDLSTRPFRVVSYNAVYLADTLVIATGATAVHLDVPGEREMTGRGVSYCATCDGWFFKEKDVIVVGGGDSAVEEGLFLTRYARKVTIVHRRDSLRAGAVLQKRAKENPKVQFIWNTVVEGIQGNGAVTGVVLRNTQTGEKCVQATDGVFIFIGHSPNTDMFKGQLDMDERGFIKTDMLMRTSKEGVYVAGEAGDPNFRQVVTSAGMGAGAAMQAIRFLEAHEN